MCTHPWYLDPCLGIPIPGRASSVRRILHLLSSASSKNTAHTISPRKVRMCPLRVLYAPGGLTYIFGRSLGSGGGQWTLWEPRGVWRTGG